MTVSLSATDPDGTADVSKITYRASGAQTITPTDVAGASAAPTITAEGQTTVSFHATDRAGNVETPDKSFTVWIDKTTPKTTATPNGPLGTNGWYTGPVSVTLAASDANGSLPVSGVKQTLYNLDGAGFQDYATAPAGGIPISGNGTHTLTFYSLDGAGNLEDQANPSNTLTIKIDSTAPTTSATLSGTAGSNGWYRSAVSVTLSATDAPSGVASTSYRLDGSASQTYTGSIAVSGDGTHTITFASTGGKTFTVTGVDNVGNTAAPQSISYAVGYNVAPLYDQTRAVKSGATIPIKLQLTDASGTNVSSSAVTVHATGVTKTTNNATGTLEDPGNANPDNDFRYDSSLGGTGGYIFNLKTTGLTTGTYTLSFTAGSDPTTHTVSFQVK